MGVPPVLSHLGTGQAASDGGVSAWLGLSSLLRPIHLLESEVFAPNNFRDSLLFFESLLLQPREGSSIPSMPQGKVVRTVKTSNRETEKMACFQVLTNTFT